MTANASPRVAWVHPTTNALWLRLVDAPVGRLVLVHQDGRTIEIAAIDDGDSLDVDLPLSAPIDGEWDPDGRWNLAVEDGRRQLPLRPIRGAIRGLPDFRIQNGVGSYRIRCRGHDGTVHLQVDADQPWAELLETTSNVGNVTATFDVPAHVGAPQRLIWRERDGQGSFDVPLARHDGRLAATTDTDLFPSPQVRQVTWDAWVCATSDGEEHELRLGISLADLTNPGREVVLPRPRSSKGAPVSVQPRLTRYGNLSMMVDMAEDDRSIPARGSASRTTKGPSDTRSVRRPGDVGSLPPRWYHRAVRAVAAGVFRAMQPRPTDRPSAIPERPVGPVHLLLADLHAFGGTIRTVVNTANALAPRTETHIVSTYRLSTDLPFPVDDRVDQKVLVDYPWLETLPDGSAHAWLRRALLRVPSALITSEDSRSDRYSLWSDLQLLRWLRSVRHGTIVTTRAGLNVAVARHARPGVALIGQQHLAMAAQKAPRLQATFPNYRRLHAVTALTRTDLHAVREQLAGSETHAVQLVNPLSGVRQRPSDRRAPRLIMAGRYTRNKGLDLLLESMADIAAAHPDWELRIYGKASRQDLAWARDLVEQYGLHRQVRLMAPTDRLELEMSKASMALLSSRREAFGMVILEAMSCALPVVAFDCPSGPREVITHGHDGLLVPPEDPAAFAEAVCSLIDDPDRRDALGQAALETSARYAPERIADDLLDIITQLPHRRAGYGE